MITLSGSPVSSGLAIGKAFVFSHSQPHVIHEHLPDKASAKREEQRFTAASDEVYAQIEALIAHTSSKDETELLEAQLLMVRDPEFTNEVSHLINDELYNAAWAVETAADKLIKALSSLPDELFRERRSDVGEISSRIIAALTSEPTISFSFEEKKIIVCDTLLPLEFISMGKDKILGIVLESGGSASHIAILARSALIPCVMGVHDVASSVKEGALVAIDGDKGKFYIDPDKTQLDAIYEEEKRREEHAKCLEEDALLPAITTDGKRIILECNIEGPSSVPVALNAGCEGIGLLRTEFLLMDRTFSDNIEEASTKVYSSIASSFKNRGNVTIRTYDIGGDKVISDIGIDEDNPVLGWRAVRFCMDRKDIFRCQLRAILRASINGNVRIMFPMISGKEELEGVLDFFDEVKEECRRDGIAFDENMKVGIMIEVPSAAITSDLLAKKVDFFSVGTNDLVQYTIAVDRGNDKISYLYNTLHPAVLRLLKLTADNAKEANIEIAMCGEMAGDLRAIPLLVGLGYTSLSMSGAREF